MKKLTVLLVLAMAVLVSWTMGDSEGLLSNRSFVQFDLKGGWTQAVLTEFKAHMDYYSELWKNDLKTRSGSISCGGDITFMPLKRVGLRVGGLTTRFHVPRESNTVNIGWTDAYFDYSIRMSAAKLEVVFIPLLTRSLQLSVFGGPGVYFVSFDQIDGLVDRMESTMEYKGKNVGFQGGLGIDIRIVKGVHLLFEGVGRLVHIKEFEGDWELQQTSWPTYSGSGILQVLDDYLGPPEYFAWFIQDQLEQAEMNFSGISFQTGIRIFF